MRCRMAVVFQDLRRFRIKSGMTRTQCFIIKNVYVEIKDLKKIYCIGIKGAGMAAVAQILQCRGVDVSGSDTSEVFYTDAILHRLKIQIHEKFSADNIPGDADSIMYSTSYTEQNNVEMAENG